MRVSAGAGFRPNRKASKEKLRLGVVFLAFALAGVSAGRAGELIVYNLSNRTVTCSVEGYTKGTGAEADVAFRVEPGQRLNIPPSFKSKGSALNTQSARG